MSEDRFTINGERGVTSGADVAPEEGENRGAIHWTKSITKLPECAHCGARRHDNYCPKCGQRHLHKRLTLGPLIRELSSKLTDIERGLLHTFLWMFRDPGRVIKDYVRGNQRQYTNPLTYFFIGTAVQIVAFWSVEASFRDEFVNQLDSAMQVSSPLQDKGELASKTAQDSERVADTGNNPVNPPDAPLKNAGEADEDLEGRPPEGNEKPFDKLIGKSLPEAMADSYVSAIQQGYAYAALFCFVFPYAVLLSIFHRAIDEDFQVGETVVFALFIFAHILIVTGGTLLVTYPISPRIHMTLAMGIYAVLPQVAHTSFFQRTWVSRLMTFLATFLAFMPFALSIIVIFLGSFFAKLGWALWTA